MLTDGKALYSRRTLVAGAGLLLVLGVMLVFVELRLLADRLVGEFPLGLEILLR